MAMKKGDIVQVNAVVYTARRDVPLESRKETLLHRPNHGLVRTCLFRAEVTPWQGLVVGRSHLQTGDYFSGSSYDGRDVDSYKPPRLYCDKAHIVLMVSPMDTERYLRPVTVLEPDALELLFVRLAPDYA